MAYSLPLVKSTIVGFSNWEVILNHRGYLFSRRPGVCLFHDLPVPASASLVAQQLSVGLVISVCTLMLSFRYADIGMCIPFCIRAIYALPIRRVNNQYVATPKLFIHQYDFSVEQRLDDFLSEVTMRGVALDSSAVFTFCLNPGLTVRSVDSDGQPLKFKRDKQIVLVDFGTNHAKGETLP